MQVCIRLRNKQAGRNGHGVRIHQPHFLHLFPLWRKSNMIFAKAVKIVISEEAKTGVDVWIEHCVACICICFH